MVTTMLQRYQVFFYLALLKHNTKRLILDIRKGMKANLQFRLGKPFKPFEQLMGVLPDRSKSLVPKAYWVRGLRTPVLLYAKI